MAVGYYTTGQTGDQATLAEAWNGHSWSIVPTPNPGPSFGTVLSAVSCPSAGFCVAAGTWTNSAASLIRWRNAGKAAAGPSRPWLIL